MRQLPRNPPATAAWNPNSAVWIAGGLLVFSFSMLEVSDSLILAQQEAHYPITKAILELSQRPHRP